jgi:PTH1 family peptidyl-tRNA hydrolase
MGSKEFLRLRIGIGHPGNAKQVSDFVLSRPSNADRQGIEDAIYEAQRVMPALLDGDVEKGMRELH